MFVGSHPRKIHDQITDIIAQTAANELIVTTMMHSHAARVRSYELIAETFQVRSIGTEKRTLAGIG